MRKLFMAAAAVTLAIATAPTVASTSEAAQVYARGQAPNTMFAAGPERGPDSQYCKLAKFQRNAPSWNAYYGCLRGPARQAYASAPMPAPTGRFADRTFAAGPERGPNSQYCKLAKFQRNAPSWNEYYGCLRH